MLALCLLLSRAKGSATTRTSRMQEKNEKKEQTKEQMVELEELEELETDRATQSMLKSQLFVPALEASLHNFANEPTHRSHLDPHPRNLFGCIRQ